MAKRKYNEKQAEWNKESMERIGIRRIHFYMRGDERDLLSYIPEGETHNKFFKRHGMKALERVKNGLETD